LAATENTKGAETHGIFIEPLALHIARRGYRHSDVLYAGKTGEPG
jgi:hypothetical protein